MGIAIGTGETRRMTNADPQFKRLTKVEEEANLQKAEQEAKRKKDDEERRAKEDEMIEQIERDFHANRAAMVDGTAKMVEGERRRGPGIPVAAPVSLDSLINDDDLDRLQQFFEDGNEIVLEPREKIEAVADDDTLKKAQKMVELLTQTMHQGEEKWPIAQPSGSNVCRVSKMQLLVVRNVSSLKCSRKSWRPKMLPLWKAILEWRSSPTSGSSQDSKQHRRWHGVKLRQKSPKEHC